VIVFGGGGYIAENFARMVAVVTHTFLQQQQQQQLQQPVQLLVQQPVQQPVQPVLLPVQKPVQQPEQLPVQKPVQQPVQLQQPVLPPLPETIPDSLLHSSSAFSSTTLFQLAIPPTCHVPPNRNSDKELQNLQNQILGNIAKITRKINA